MIAQTIVYSYQVSIQEEMIIRAVRANQLYFLYCVFAFNKNYEYRPPDVDIELSSSSSDSGKDQIGSNSRDAEE